jgi:hypothetical protein
MCSVCRRMCMHSSSAVAVNSCAKLAHIAKRLHITAVASRYTLQLMKEMFSAGSSTSSATATASPPGGAATVRSAVGITTTTTATATVTAASANSGSPKTNGRGKSVGFSLPGDSLDATSAVTSQQSVDSPVTPLQLAPLPEQPSAVAPPLSDSW